MLHYAVAICLVVICTDCVSATIVESVNFTNAVAEPTALQKRLAAAQNRPVPLNESTPLTGTVYRPDDNGRHPALVLLHGSRGPQTYQHEWAKKLVEWGYVALLIDSFSPRGIESTCNDLIDGVKDSSHGRRVYDAYGGFEYLAAQAWVDELRVGIMGWTYSATLGASIKQGVQQFFRREFKAVVAISPECAYTTSGEFVAPVLVLSGEGDTWRPVSGCRKMRDNSLAFRFPVTLKTYPDAVHSFDDTTLIDPLQLSGIPMLHAQHGGVAYLQYNERAHRQAQADVRAFLDANI